MIKILMSGYKGKLGSAICSLAAATEGFEIAAGIDPVTPNPSNPFPTYQDISDCCTPCDVIIDCSIAPAVPAVVKYAADNNTPIVVCTTGLTDETLCLIDEASKKIPVFRSANMSLGINLICALTEKLVKVLGDASFDIEIVEKHHRQKLDAPSGTAFMLADSINKASDMAYEYIFDRSTRRMARDKKELGIHAVRGGTIVGEHSVIFAGNDEVLEIKHSAASKEVFAIGALKAAKYVSGKQQGLYDMKNLIEEA